MKEFFTQNRKWVGISLVLGGAGLELIHYIDYGVTLHFPTLFLIYDHGVVGLILMMAGAILGFGKPKEK